MSSRRCPGHPVHLLLRQFFPIVVLALYSLIRDAVGHTPGPRGSYYPIPSHRWYLLETIDARLHGGGVVSVFVRSFVVLEAGVGCTDSRVHGKHRAIVD